MARTFNAVIGLLLFCLIKAGVNGEDTLIPVGRGYNIRFHQDKAACFYLWQFNTLENNDLIAIVANGKIQTSTWNNDDSNWTLQIKDLTEDDVGNHRCSQSTASTAASKRILVPGKTSMLQCVLLTNSQRSASTQEISLMWADGDGAQIPEDIQIHQTSSYDVTLILDPQSSVNKEFRCQVTVDGQVQTSADVWVGFPGRGRGIIEPETKGQGHGWDVAGAAVGVVGCVVLTALIAAFAVNRKRADRQLPDESCNTISSNNVMNTDDVVYAEIVLPVGSDAVWVQECEATEYACIRYE